MRDSDFIAEEKSELSWKFIKYPLQSLPRRKRKVTFGQELLSEPRVSDWQLVCQLVCSLFKNTSLLSLVLCEIKKGSIKKKKKRKMKGVHLCRCISNYSILNYFFPEASIQLWINTKPFLSAASLLYFKTLNYTLLIMIIQGN